MTENNPLKLKLFPYDRSLTLSTLPVDLTTLDDFKDWIKKGVELLSNDVLLQHYQGAIKNHWAAKVDENDKPAMIQQVQLAQVSIASMVYENASILLQLKENKAKLQASLGGKRRSPGKAILEESSSFTDTDDGAPILKPKTPITKPNKSHKSSIVKNDVDKLREDPKFISLVADVLANMNNNNNNNNNNNDEFDEDVHNFMHKNKRRRSNSGNQASQITIPIVGDSPFDQEKDFNPKYTPDPRSVTYFHFLHFFFSIFTFSHPNTSILTTKIHFFTSTLIF